MKPIPNPIDRPLLPVDLVRLCGRVYRFTPADEGAMNWFLAPAGPGLQFGRADRVILAIRDGQCCGYACLREASSFAILDDLVVLPEYRRSGVARQLMEPVLYDVGRPEGVSRILCDWPEGEKWLGGHNFLAAMKFGSRVHPRLPGMLRFTYPSPR